MTRTSDSLKQMAKPSLVASKMLFSPFVFMTAISSSPSLSVSARMPAFLAVLRLESRTLLTVPCFVTNMRLSSSNSWTVMPAVTVSPGSNGRMFTIFVPFAVLPASGIW